MPPKTKTLSAKPPMKTAPSARPKKPELSGLKPAEAMALKVVAAGLEKEARDHVRAGAHDVNFLVRVLGRLNVKPDIPDAASSSAPDTAHLVAWILSQASVKIRAKILRELPQLFAENGCELPKVDELFLDQVAGTLKRLRKTSTGPKRGAVSGEFEIVPMELGALALAGGRERVETLGA
jgi:hypothetical protein